MSGNIVEVSEATWEAEVLQSDRPVVVDFWAPWCGPCRAMNPIFSELSEAHPEVKFVKVNVDDNMGLQTTYDVLSIPTLMVFEHGAAAKKLIGAMPKGKLTAELGQWLGVAA